MSQSNKYREVYELYQLCSNSKDLKEFCIDAGVNYNKFREWQRNLLFLPSAMPTFSCPMEQVLCFATPLTRKCSMCFTN